MCQQKLIYLYFPLNKPCKTSKLLLRQVTKGSLKRMGTQTTGYLLRCKLVTLSCQATCVIKIEESAQIYFKGQFIGFKITIFPFCSNNPIQNFRYNLRSALSGLAGPTKRLIKEQDGVFNTFEICNQDIIHRNRRN